MRPRGYTVELLGAGCADCGADFRLGEQVIYRDQAPRHAGGCPPAVSGGAGGETVEGQP